MAAEKRTLTPVISVALVVVALTIAIASSLKRRPPVEVASRAEEPRQVAPAPARVEAPPSPSVAPIRETPPLVVGADAGFAAKAATVTPPAADRAPASEPVKTIHVRGKSGPTGEGSESNGGNSADAGYEMSSLDKDAIRAGINAAIPLVKRCYEEELARKADAAGTIQVKFNIVAKDGKGRIDEASITEESTLNGFELQSCVLRELSKADFPMPAGNGQVVVHYPFKFSSTEE